MPEVIFPGPEGRLEGRYHPQKEKDAPIAIVLHPHPQSVSYTHLTLPTIYSV